MSSSLTLSSVSKVFNQGHQAHHLFENLSYDFKQGSSYAITGISGTGKSTLLAMLGGIEKPTKGSITYNNFDLSQLENGKNNHFYHKIGFVFQLPHLVRELSVLDNITLKGRIAGLSEHECKQKGQDLLALVMLSDKESALPAQLSGGEQQRVALARALFLEPDFLLADEPTAHLDKNNRILIIDILKQYQSNPKPGQHSMGVILSTHDSQVSSCMDIILAIQDKTLHEVPSVHRADETRPLEV